MIKTIILLAALLQALPFPGPGAASGASRVFNGTNAELTTANGYLGSSSAFTILTWFKIANISQTNSYLASSYKSGGGGEQVSLIFGYVGGKLELFASGYTGTDPRLVAGQITIGDTNWHYGGYRYDGTKLEKNLDGTWTTIANPIVFVLSTAGFNNFVIGSAGGTGWLASSVDDFRIYTSAISDGDAALAKLCQATSATPVGWWLMTGASPEPDSGSGNHSLTVTNATVGSGAPCS